MKIDNWHASYVSGIHIRVGIGHEKRGLSRLVIPMFAFSGRLAAAAFAACAEFGDDRTDTGLHGTPYVWVGFFVYTAVNFDVMVAGRLVTYVLLVVLGR